MAKTYKVPKTPAPRGPGLKSGRKGARAVRPKLAATMIVLTGPKDAPRILLGRRRSGMDFMPGVFVFPGGRVERADSYAPFVGTLSERTAFILGRSLNPRRARACVLAAIRETFEETGYAIGRPVSDTFESVANPAWKQFVDAGYLPDLDGVEVMGRAITPPYRTKRFDTWFFVRWVADEGTVGDSGELEHVGWYDLSAVPDMQTHRATDVMLDALDRYLRREDPEWKIRFMRQVRGVFVTDKFPVADPDGD